MATDATGTPTPKGIPTYNPDADAPSGLGFNAAMAAIDGLLTYLKVRKNSGGADFERQRLNLIEGAGITLIVADDAGNNEVDVTIAATGGGGTKWQAVDLRNPNTNAFPTVVALTDWEAWHWQFVKDVDGKIFGVVRVPEDITPASPQLILEIGANATSGVTRLSVATKAVADAESLNPGALTSETAQDITVPGTARFRKMVTFNITETLAAGDVLLVEVFHEGAHANDTLAVNTELYGAWLKVA